MRKYFACILGGVTALCVLLGWWTYTTDRAFADRVNLAVTIILLCVGLTVALVLVVRYGLPAFWQSAEAWSRLQDARVERHLKLTRYAPSATGMYEIPARQMDAGAFLPAMQAATLHSQYEEPRFTMGTSAPAQLTGAAAGALALPDDVWLADYLGKTNGRFALGVQPDGELLTLALPDVWHLLNNAQSGGGKSNNIDSFITQVHYLPHHNPVEMYGMDFKGELRATWKRSPLFVELATQDQLPAMITLAESLVKEIHARNRTFETYADQSGRIVKGFNDYTRLSRATLPLVYLIVDEMNALMGYAKKNDRLESALGTILQMGRSAGVNVLMGAQHLTADVLPKAYYTNIATRVMLGQYDATNTTRLLGSKPRTDLLPLLTGQPGRALVRINGTPGAVAVQMLRVDEGDILDGIRHARAAQPQTDAEPLEPRGTAWERETVGSTETHKTGENELLTELLIPRSHGVPPRSEGSTSVFAESIVEYQRKYWGVKYLRVEGLNKEAVIKHVWGVSKGRNYAGPSAEYDAITTQLDAESAAQA